MRKSQSARRHGSTNSRRGSSVLSERKCKRPRQSSEMIELAESKNNPDMVEKERGKIIVIFQEESGKNEDWNKKYIHSTMFLLGYGAYGSVFQVTTRLYSQSKNKIAKDRFVFHPDFIATFASQRKLKMDQQEKLKDSYRNDRLFDIVAIKYEILDQSHLEDGVTRFYLFLRREFLVLDTVWRRFPRLLVGFPVVFDFGYIGDRLQYGVNPKYKSIFTYLNMQGEEVKFFADTLNRNLEGVTKISYMAMELLGPSIEDYRSYFAPWFAASDIRPYFQVRTAFRIADQLLCRLFMLHRAGFVHHDLKPDNLAVGNGRALNTIYLLDFGFAKQVSDSSVAEWMGSRKYISVDTYNNERPNYAQDIESWFYVTLALLFDMLPWCDDVIQPIIDPAAEEGAKWALVCAIKKTWWGEYNAADTFHSMLDSLQGIHEREVPDIRQIAELLHRKVRDLRSHLRQFSDANSINSEMANNQSVACRGYMSIRKVLLQIFDLPTIGRNSLLGDNEFRSFQESRKAQGLKPFQWDPSNFEWEWDKNHDRMFSSKEAMDPGRVSSSIAGSENDIAELIANSAFQTIGEKLGSDGKKRFVPSESHNTAKVREQIQRLATQLDLRATRLRTRVQDGGAAPTAAGTAARRERPEEVSYVYNAATNTLVPKQRPAHRRQPGEQVSRPQSADNRRRGSAQGRKDKAAGGSVSNREGLAED